MQTIKFGSFTLLLLAALCSVASCNTLQTFKNMSGSQYDVTHNAQGKEILADTPRMWQDFKFKTDLGIQDEATGNSRPGGRTPNEAWLSVIRHIQSSTEHPQKYINYIIERRRAAGLPELVGYP